MTSDHLTVRSMMYTALCWKEVNVWIKNQKIIILISVIVNYSDQTKQTTMDSKTNIHDICIPI